ncbi:nuclear transport factor 2 domain protein [Fusarium sp. NRRL 25303]|nr:nuclear transport factor 2 domain protein [Fusarium sp. NRRL 25303]
MASLCLSTQCYSNGAIVKLAHRLDILGGSSWIDRPIETGFGERLSSHVNPNTSNRGANLQRWQVISFFIPPKQQLTNSAAEIFTSNYYQAINRQKEILPFYINSSQRYPIAADISINGAVLPTPDDYSKLLEAQGKDAHYEIESFDAHVLNPNFTMGAPENIFDSAKKEKSGDKMSILVTVMGRVQFGKGREAPQKMFNETFVLVPNWESMVKNPPKGVKKWLVMSQNFRAL